MIRQQNECAKDEDSDQRPESYVSDKERERKALIRLSGCEGWSASDIVGMQQNRDNSRRCAYVSTDILNLAVEICYLCSLHL